MALVDDINRFLFLFADTFRLAGRGRIWWFLLVYFLLNWLLLYAHYNFLSPFFYTVVTGWLSLFGGETAAAFTHYPAHLYYLSDLFGWSKLALGLVLEGLVLGAVAVIFGRHFMGQRDTGSAFRYVLPKWGYLVLAWAVINSLMLAAGEVLPGWLQPLFEGPRRSLAFALVVMPSVYILILALFFFTIPSVAVFGDNLFRALGRSLRIFVRKPFTCIFLSGAVLFFPIVVSILSGYSAGIIEKFKPELIYWILLTGLVLEMVANFFWMGVSVRFLIDEEN